MQRKNKIMNQWMKLNHILFIYKVIGLGLVGVSLFLTALCFYLSDRTPVVIKEIDNDFIYFVGRKRNIPLTEKNLQRFVSNYINLRYKWDKLDSLAIVENIDPFVTEGLKRKIRQKLRIIENRDFKGKVLKQNISAIEVKVTKTSTVAIFDRILRVNDIPLLLPTQVAFSFTRGKKSFWNQMGLFINGVTIHEDH